MNLMELTGTFHSKCKFQPDDISIIGIGSEITEEFWEQTQSWLTINN